MSVWSNFNSAINALDISEATWIVGLSGGMDSVTLLHLCHRYSEASDNPPKIIAAHLNHQLRGKSSDVDEDFCRDLCEKWRMPFHSEKCCVSGLSGKNNTGLEETGRLARHELFARLIAKNPNAVVLLAHHEDDQYETVLMNIRRGAHLRGLSGISPQIVIKTPDGGCVRIARPLLKIPRDSLQKYARENNLQWREDESNTDLKFTRNRTRHEMIPHAEKLIPGFRKMVLKIAEASTRSDLELREQSSRFLLENMRAINGGFILPTDEINPVNDEVFMYAMRTVIEDKLESETPSAAVFNALWKLATSGRTGAEIQISAKAGARRENSAIYFYTPEDTGKNVAEELIFPKPPFSVEYEGMLIEATTHAAPASIPESDAISSGTEWFDADSLRYPLSIRKRRPGDRMQPLGASGGKKVKDILIDRKVPKREKDKCVVISDYAGIIWLWPCCIANRARLQNKSRQALRIIITRPGE